MKIEEITIEITSNCSLKCLHCSSNSSPAKKNFLEKEKIFDIISEAYNLKAKNISLSGGEPFNHPSFSTILDFVKSREISLRIYTSGNMFNNGKITSLSSSLLKKISNYIHTLIFSIHGANAKTHDYITNTEGSFSNMLQSVKKAKSFNIPIKFHFVPMLPNFNQMEDVITFAKEKGGENISFLRFVPQGRGREKLNKKMLDIESSNKNKEFTKRLKHLFNEYNDFLRIGSPFNALNLHKNPLPCASGKGKVLITPNGKAYTCEAFKRFTNRGYDIFNNSLKKFIKETWDQKFLKLLNEEEISQPDDWRVKGCIAQKLWREHSKKNKNLQ